MADCARSRAGCPECWNVGDVYRYAKGTSALERSVLAWLREVGVTATVSSRVRSCNEQAGLYRAGQTSAAPSTSQHEFGFAFDLVPRTGFTRYGASFAEAVAWVVLVAEALGGFGLAERSHAHVTLYSNDAWRRFLTTRGVVLTLPLPGKKPKG